MSRCRELADALTRRGCDVFFLVKTDDIPAVSAFIDRSAGAKGKYNFLTDELTQDADVSRIIRTYSEGFSFLVLDHYKHDLKYQKKLKEGGVNWAQFDYRAEDKILADIIINANPSALTAHYRGLVTEKACLCVGPDFAIIRGDVRNMRPLPQKGQILIAMGAGECPDEVITLIQSLTADNRFHFVVIAQDERLKKILPKKENTELHINADNIASFYGRCETAVVAGGVTAFELAYLRKPMLIVPFAENQLPNARAWDQNGFGIFFPDISDFIRQCENLGLPLLLADLKIKTENRKMDIDGRGAERIADCILEKGLSHDY